MSDIRYALRRLRHSPAFALVAVVTLALGIGAGTAIFTVVDSVLLRPLQFLEPDRLAMVRPSSGARLSAAYLREWRAERRMFADLAGWFDARAGLTGRGEPREVFVDRTTANFFDVLGMPPLLGRTFTADAALASVDREVVLGYGLWQRVYGGDPGVIGQPITLDGELHTIVGVMPAAFVVRTNELAASRAELWTPFPLDAGAPDGMGGFLTIVGRLGDGATFDQARDELSLVSALIEERFPSYSRDWTLSVTPLGDATVEQVRPTLLVLFGAVGILLLMACVNVASLLLMRGVARRPELAIRASLGATRPRIVRQILTESLVIAALGGALGVLAAVWATGLLVSLLPSGLELPRASEISVDRTVLLFACGLTVATGLLFGVLPALTSSRPAPAARATSNRGGSALIVAEVAFALVLLAGAGLLVRSVDALTRVDPGFDPAQVITVGLTLPAAQYENDDRIRAFTGALLDRLQRTPGIASAGFASYLPLSQFGAANGFQIEGRPPGGVDDWRGAWTTRVGGRFFEAMGIPLVRGRFPGESDTARSEPAFVIDETLARRYWPDDDPLGERLIWDLGDGQTLSGAVIGIAASVRWQALSADAPGTAYWWLPQAPDRDLTVVARATDDPAALVDRIAAHVRALDPSQPIGRVRAMTELVADQVARTRFTMLVLGGFAAVALLLAIVGLYGVVAFAAAQRTREIGVRVALGARRGDVMRLVLRQGAILAGAGLAAGLAASLALGRAVEGLLYGVDPADARTLAAVALLLAVVSLAASYVPARRAAQIDPAVALRQE